jgi:hypothetical protein
VNARRVFLLLGHDPAVGLAVRPAGVLGLEPDGFHASFIPYEPAADSWRDRILMASVSPAEAVEEWLGTADGVAFDILEMPPPDGAPDLRTAVESVVDGLLALPTE